MALFNVSKGKYGKANLKDNSLTENALQKPEIYAAMIRLRDQYGFTYLTEGTGRVKMFETEQTEWGNNTLEWYIKGRGERPSTVAGAIQSGSGTSKFVLPVAENYLNKKEVVKFENGYMAFITGEAQGSGPYFYPFEIITIDESTGLQLTVTNADIPVGTQISVYSNLNEERSKEGFGTISFPDKYKSFLSIHRRSLTVSGSGLQNVAWVTNTKNRQSMWYFEAEDEVEKQMLQHMDRWRLYGRKTISADGKPFVNYAGKPVWAGDGVFAQIEGINDWSVNNDDEINRDNLADYISHLATKSTDFDNNHWVVMTGARGANLWHKYFEASMVDNGNMCYSYVHGKPIEMGGNFTSYRVGTNTISIVRAAIFDDENIHSKRDSNGYLLESSRMVFMNYGKIDKESNIMIGVRKGAQGNRGLIKKYIPGMADPFNLKMGSLATNSNDGFDVEWLSESGVVIKNPYACGQWIRKS
jgi:hypothetical protein